MLDTKSTAVREEAVRTITKVYMRQLHWLIDDNS